MKHGTGEIVTAMIWLSLGAIFSLLLEIVYLSSGPFPFMVVIAYFFNGVLTKTAKLWSPWASYVPLAVWLVAFFVFMLGPGISGSQLVPSNIRTVLLLIAGIVGGVWPVPKSK